MRSKLERRREVMAKLSTRMEADVEALPSVYMRDKFWIKDLKIMMQFGNF